MTTTHISLEIRRPDPSLVYSSCKTAPDVVGTKCALATPWQKKTRVILLSVCTLHDLVGSLIDFHTRSLSV